MATTEVVKREQEVLPRRWEPYRLLEDMEREIDRLFNEPLFAWPRATMFPRFTQTAVPFAPRVDVFEQEGQLVVKAELPGMKKEDIAVELEKDALVIKGEHKAEHEVKEEAYYRKERSYGQYFRRIPLPVEVQPEQIKAHYSEGVLELRIPMPKEEKPKAKHVTIA